MAQMNGMEKRNFTNSVRNGGKMAEMRNNSAKSGMVGMSVFTSLIQSLIQSLTATYNEDVSLRDKQANIKHKH